jgi:hypothetical protein
MRAYITEVLEDLLFRLERRQLRHYQGPNKELYLIKARCRSLAEISDEVNMPYLNATSRYQKLKLVSYLAEDLAVLLQRQLPLAHNESEAELQKRTERNASDGLD